MLSELERELFMALSALLREGNTTAAIEASNKALENANKYGAAEAVRLYHIRQRSYMIDPECWAPYTDKSREYKQKMEMRRSDSIRKAREIEEKNDANPA